MRGTRRRNYQRASGAQKRVSAETARRMKMPRLPPQSHVRMKHLAKGLDSAFIDHEIKIRHTSMYIVITGQKIGVMFAPRVNGYQILKNGTSLEETSDVYQAVAIIRAHME